MEWQLGLNFYSSKLCIFNPADLANEQVRKEIESDKYHVYMICKRKKMFFESSRILEDGQTETTLYWLNEKHDNQYQKVISISGVKINAVQDGYYNIDYQGHSGIQIKEPLMVNSFFFLGQDVIGTSVADPLPSDLEVMYVGQAFGRTSTKKIDYRLANHDKIQKIALEVLNSGSNEEVLIIGIKVETNDIATSFVNLGADNSTFTLENAMKLRNKAEMRVSDGQQITIFEASLISFFQPKWNTEYKSSFPSPDFDSYDEIYETEFDYSGLTVDTFPVRARVFSAHIPERKYLHHHYFPLKEKASKKTLFEFLYGDRNDEKKD